MKKLLGYARVSTNKQELNLQLDALKQAGVKEEDIYIDKVSGIKAEKPNLNNCLKKLNKGDTLIVWKLDRLGRHTASLILLIEDLKAREINFKSLSDGIMDTTTPQGIFIFKIFASFSRLERDLIQERTEAGLKAARARGRVGGRPPIDPNNPKVRMAKEMYQNKKLTIKEICDTLEISRATLYRWVRR